MIAFVLRSSWKRYHWIVSKHQDGMNRLWKSLTSGLAKWSIDSNQQLTRHVIMSSHGNAFCVTGTFWWYSITHRWIPLKRSQISLGNHCSPYGSLAEHIAWPRSMYTLWYIQVLRQYLWVYMYIIYIIISIVICYCYCHCHCHRHHHHHHDHHGHEVITTKQQTLAFDGHDLNMATCNAVMSLFLYTT